MPNVSSSLNKIIYTGPVLTPVGGVGGAPARVALTVKHSQSEQCGTTRAQVPAESRSLNFFPQSRPSVDEVDKEKKGSFTLHVFKLITTLCHQGLLFFSSESP